MSVFFVLPLIFLLFICLNFSKKLICLLMLEGSMLCLISSNYSNLLIKSPSINSLGLIFMIFLVLDSVFGLSLLGNMTRFSSFSVPFRFNF